MDGRVRARVRVTPRAVSRLTLVVAAWFLLVLVNPRFMRRMHLEEVLGNFHPAEPGVAVAAALLLLGLAQGLGRAKRRAWQLTVVLLIPELFIQVHLHHRIAALGASVLLVLLFLGRDGFTAQSDPDSRWRAPRVGGLLASASIAIGWLAITILNDEVHGGHTARRRLIMTLKGLIGIPTALTEPTGRLPDVVYYLLLTLGATTIAITAWLLLRSATMTSRLSREEESQLRTAMERQVEHDSLDYFATRDDRSLVWSPAGGACISYRVIAGTALAAGDPIGPRAQWGEAIVAFLALARAHGWVPAVVATSQVGAQAWSRWGGLNILEFGDEAILHADEFTLEGRDMRNVRHAVTRATKAGCSVEIMRMRDLGAARAEQLTTLAHEWRIGDVERGFSMALGRVDPHRDPNSVVVLALQGADPIGLLVFVPWGPDGLSLDLMRRDSRSESVNELMIAALMERLGTFGVRQVSLNFAAFRDAIERAERIGAGPVTRIWGRLLQSVSRWSQADSLYRFNAKFRPEWRPRYIGYASASGLPRLALAYLDAEALVTLPRRRGRERHT